MSLSYQTLLGTSNLTVDTIQSQSIYATQIQAATIDVTSKLTVSGLSASKLLGTNASNAFTSVTLSAGARNNLTITNPSDTSIVLDTVAVPTFTKVQTASTFTVDNTMTIAAIQSAISNTSYNVIEFQTGTYNLTTYLNVNRDNIILKGNRSTLYIANAANCPGIFVGDMTTNPPTITYRNIIVQDFIINGNRTNQTTETCAGKAWIYNNCIGINLCEYVLIERCRLVSAKSGGFTSTYNSKNISVRSCYASDNYFDGLTAYGTKNLIFASNECVSNFNGAGISIDQGCQYVTIVGNNLTSNAHSGIFMRFCTDVNITGNVISQNLYQGIFIAGNYDGGIVGPNKRYIINSNVITNNLLDGVYLQSCQFFTICGNTISANNSIGLTIGSDNATHGLCSYNNISGNVICNNAATGVYLNANNSYANGARDNYLSLNIVKGNTTFQVNGDLTAYTLEDDSALQTQKVVLNNSGNKTSLYGNPSGTANFQFPANGGTAGFGLITDGSGNTSWTGTNIVSATTTFATVTNSNTFVSAGFAVTITPRYTSSKIKVTVSGQIEYTGAASAVYTIYQTIGGVSTDLSGGSGLTSISINGKVPAHITILDTPNTTSAITYDLYFKAVTGSGNAIWNPSGHKVYIEALEIN